jgi:hypothetical protein
MTSDEERISSNRQRRLDAIRTLERLLREAADEEFRGTVAVELPAKDGRLGAVKETRIRFR